MINIVALLAVLGFAGAVVQTVAGFGATFFLLPALLIYFQPSTAITVSLLVANTVCLLVLAERRVFEFSWPIILRVVLAALPGMVLGAYITTRVSQEISQIIVGLVIIGAVLVQQHAYPKDRATTSLRFSKWAAASGFIAGILNAVASMAGPALVLWLRSYTVTKNQIRDTLAICFLIMNTTSIIMIYFFKPVSVTYEGLVIFLWIAPLIILGNLLGRWILPKIKPDHYRNILFFTVLLAGVLSVVLGAVGLLR